MENPTWPPRQTSPSLPVALVVLRVVMIVQILLAIAVLPVAAFFVVGDLSDRTDEWDGLVAFLGALAGGLALVLIGVGVLVLRLLRRNPVAAGAIAIALGGFALLQGLHQGSSIGLGAADAWAVLVGLVLAVPGLAVVVAARTGGSR